LREKRSLFQKIFGVQKQASGTKQYLQMLNGYSPTFSTYSGNPYDSDAVRSAIDSIARNAAKLKPKHIRRYNGQIQDTGSTIEQLLSLRPNPYMNAYDFYYKIVTQRELKNNAFIYIDWDPITLTPRGFYPIPYSSIDFLESNDPADKTIYAKFYFGSGQQLTVPYDNLIHLRRFFNENDLFGESNDTALTPAINLVNTSNDGIINGIKSSAYLRGILKFTGALRPEDMKAQRDRFLSDYMDISNNGGVAATDAKTDYVDLKSDPKLIDAKQMEVIQTKVNDYFGTNEPIINSTYTEDQWNAFYESKIEPIGLQLSLEFTSKIFTSREIGFGNEIVFEANRLEYASMQTKLNLMQMVDRGAMVPNEWRAAMNLPPIEGGDKPIRRLDTAPVNTVPAAQTGGDPNGQGTDGTDPNSSAG
jgi:phage portal protein, HK97 family